ncbi:conserved hypothetical protein [Ricinus communis]|uniref:Uncharacterized protein n=1 Tax=Ricinus communis TaxID=3988 RepID=B9RUE0_RICCO|nr:conserved hypothetical protein [Ricinus communis]
MLDVNVADKIGTEEIRNEHYATLRSDIKQKMLLPPQIMGISIYGTADRMHGISQRQQMHTVGCKVMYCAGVVGKPEEKRRKARGLMMSD